MAAGTAGVWNGVGGFVVEPLAAVGVQVRNAANAPM
jgi:hypothetical protein